MMENHYHLLIETAQANLLAGLWQGKVEAGTLTLFALGPDFATVALNNS
jgi:hypothetical protein